MATLPTFRDEPESDDPREVVNDPRVEQGLATLAAPGVTVDAGHWAAMGRQVSGKAYTWQFQEDAFTFRYDTKTQLTYFCLRLRDQENIAK